MLGEIKISGFFVGREKKGQAALSRLFFRAATRMSAGPQRSGGPADFRRGLGIHYDNGVY